MASQINTTAGAAKTTTCITGIELLCTYFEAFILFRVHVRIYVCMYVCMYVFVYRGMCVSVFVCVHECISL